MPMDTINIAQNVKPVLNDLRIKLNFGTYSQTIEFLLNKYNTTSVVHSKPSIRSQVLHLMSDGNTWQLANLVTEILTDNQDYDTMLDFIEGVLENIPDIIEVGDSEYRLAQASKA